MTMTNEEINEKIMRLLGWQKIDVPAWQSPAWQQYTENGTEYWYGECPINYVGGAEFDSIVRILAGNNDRLVVEVRYQHPDAIRYTAYIITARHMKIAVGKADTYQRAVCLTFIAWREWIAEQVAGQHE